MTQNTRDGRNEGNGVEGAEGAAVRGDGHAEEGDNMGGERVQQEEEAQLWEETVSAHDTSGQWRY
jgi:hypothetical protein